MGAFSAAVVAVQAACRLHSLVDSSTTVSLDRKESVEGTYPLTVTVSIVFWVTSNTCPPAQVRIFNSVLEGSSRAETIALAVTDLHL